jgi:DNA topoisomerase I
MERATKMSVVLMTMIFHWFVYIPAFATISLADRIRQTKRRKTKPQSKSDSESNLSDKPLLHIKKPPKITAAQIGEDSDSDIPLGTKLAKEKQAIEKAQNKEAKAIRAEEKKTAPKRKPKIESSDDDEPLVKKTKSTPSAKKAINGVKKEQGKGMHKAQKTAAVKKDKGKGKIVKSEAETEDIEGEGEEEDYKWWEAPMQGDGTIKWTTLEHNGVLFPPEYEPLPKNVKLIYDGKPVSLHRDAEEIAGFYGAMLHSTVNVENPTFNKNFFADFKAKLDETGHAKDKDGNKVVIKQFEKCDFKPIFNYYEAERARKKNLSKEEKKAIKEAKDKLEAPYMYCMWDGRRQKVGNFRVEPPGLFRGRGEHPKTGKVKQRVQPEQITLNIGKDAPIPKPPEGHKWKEVKHDQEGTWLAMWQENINKAYKYVMLAANSDIKGQSDYKKFEKARELKKHIDRIRKDYTRDLKSEMMADRQRATAIYLIDKFALRAGNEKGEDEADTVGCCSLKFEHVTLKPPNIVVFDFLGKDSIPFYDEVTVDPQVFKNLKLFKKPPKGEGDEIFDRLTTSSLNKHLTNYMPGLTAKVFRTYNASYTMATLLRSMKSTGTDAEKIKDYNDANRKVAILCNHKRTVAASHAGSMAKMQEKINGLRFQHWRLKMMMIDIDPKIKKKKGAEYFELPKDLDDEWVAQHHEFLVEEERKKIRKKFEKENEKRVADGEKEMKAKELDERLKAADELAAKYKKERKTKKVEAEGKGQTIEKLDASLEKLQQRIETMKIQYEDREDNKEIALGTSKIVSFLKVATTDSILTRRRITLILDLLLSSRRSSTCQLRNSSPRLFAISSTGPSTRSTRIGSFDGQNLPIVLYRSLTFLRINNSTVCDFVKCSRSRQYYHVYSYGMTAIDISNVLTNVPICIKTEWPTIVTPLVMGISSDIKHSVLSGLASVPIEVCK